MLVDEMYILLLASPSLAKGKIYLSWVPIIEGKFVKKSLVNRPYFRILKNTLNTATFSAIENQLFFVGKSIQNTHVLLS
jgi:hypothetical protein